MVKFHPNVIRQRLNDETKQIVQTVIEMSMFDDKIAKARQFLESIGIKDMKPIYKVAENG